MSSEDNVFFMPSSVTIYDAVEVYKDLMVSLPECISLKETQEMDTCGIQLLLCVQKELKSLGRPFYLIDIQPDIAHKLKLFSLSFSQQEA